MGAQDFETKKSLGQHFLKSSSIPKRMCDAGDLHSGEIVVEIGPGTGVLTAELLARGTTVVALEADLRAIEYLEKHFVGAIAEGSLTLVHSDVRTLDPVSLQETTGGTYKVVANIPYYLSGLLFRTFLESAHHPTDIVYLVQKEVAKRITDQKKSSLLSLSVAAYGKAEYVHTVPRGAFSPPPKVDSAIIHISEISKKAFGVLPEAFFFDMLHVGFGSKRKQLLGNLSARFDRATLIHLFSTLGLSPSVRAEDMNLTQWLLLTNALYTHKAHML